MNNPTGKDQRRFLSIPDPRFQKEFTVLMIFVALSSSAIMMLGTWFMVQKITSIAMTANGGMGGELEESIARQTPNIWLMMVGVTLVNAACIAIFSFAFSKRKSAALPILLLRTISVLPLSIVRRLSALPPLLLLS